MRSLTIVIATRHRQEKLEKTLNSIPIHDWIDLIIVCDGDVETYQWLNGNKDRYNPMYTLLLPKHVGSVAARNRVTPSIQDGFLWATDDIIFKEGSIESAFKTFNKYFPDDDGVVGFVQEPGDFHPTGVGLMGLRFLMRYPGMKPFYPGFYHFACQEILYLADGRFEQDPNAVVIHKHPDAHPEEKDITHVEARRYKAQDMALIADRKNQNLVWGRDDEDPPSGHIEEPPSV